MTRARSVLIAISATPWYHLVNRCVRRAFLCGADSVSGRCFDHRRLWLISLIKRLAGVYALDVAAYAVMSNHYHLVLRVDSARARAWSPREVLRRWMLIYGVPPLVQNYVAALQAGETPELDALARENIDAHIEKYRARLADISWFMRILNETIAKQANHEDRVKGHFWEGRFKSQALLDDQAILAAMVYADLNPIRAGMAETLQESVCTSICERIATLGGSLADSADLQPLRYLQHFAVLKEQALMPFDQSCRIDNCVPFNFYDYLELAEATGRSQHPNKRGKISTDTPKLLKLLRLDPAQFAENSAKLLQSFGNAVGGAQTMEAYKLKHRYKHTKGIRAARQMNA